MMGTSEQRLSAELARLETLDRAALIEAWLKAYKTPPFKGARNSTLVRGLAYHLQCKSYGGLRPATQRQLQKIATGKQSGALVSKRGIKRRRVQAKLGTQLVREWNGKTYTVHVTDKGCVMGGVTYSSLSAVAKAITGAHWSGPRFFGAQGLAP